jgi:uncharacterized membrane protein
VEAVTGAISKLAEPGEAVLVPEAELGESRLLPALAVFTAAALYATLPEKFVTGSAAYVGVIRWVVPALAIVLVAPLVLTAPRRRVVFSIPRRTAAIGLIAVLSAANAASIVLLVHLILKGGRIDGRQLVLAAIHIWCTTVLLFALWFWQLDSGGPMERRVKRAAPPDFLFTQQSAPELSPGGWQPHFLDYLYLAFTNATAFSPTDTMPLSRWAKMLMLVEAGASLLLLVTVAARAVNILT